MTPAAQTSCWSIGGSSVTCSSGIRSSRVREELGRFVGIVGFENLEQRAVLAAGEVERQELIPFDAADAGLAAGEAVFGEFHGGLQ